MSNEAEISDSSLIIQSIYDEDDNLDYSFVEPIQINEEDFIEFDEGFHDLVGDDEQNYGNELYHTIGFHGCIRVPVEASEFIYNTSPVGTKVLVNRK